MRYTFVILRLFLLKLQCTVQVVEHYKNRLVGLSFFSRGIAICTVKNYFQHNCLLFFTQSDSGTTIRTSNFNPRSQLFSWLLRADM